MDVQARTGIELTESMAMWPGAAVSGWYFSHPQSQYFVVGRLAQDQVADYARRKGWTLQEAERWLGPNLGYNPEDLGLARPRNSIGRRRGLRLERFVPPPLGPFAGRSGAGRDGRRRAAGGRASEPECSSSPSPSATTRRSAGPVMVMTPRWCRRW